MKISEKLPIAKRAIESITKHDDAPFVQRLKAANELKEFIDNEMALAKLREETKPE